MAETLCPGTILQGRYRIVRVIGEGAMGVVYEAADLAIKGARWAVKEIHSGRQAADEQQDALALFERECRILSMLNHTGLPKVTEYFNHRCCHYMVMEFIEGESLDERLKRNGKPLDAETVLPWLFQVLDILDYLHRQNPPIIFRDLKPSNIVITAGGKAKLVDFGIARFFQQGKAQDTQIMGTPGFSAPEQYGTGQTDARSDIYALGATCYYLLSAEEPEKFNFCFPPLDGNTIPRWLSTAVMKSLEKNPAQRFQSAEEMKAFIQKGRQEEASSKAVTPAAAPAGIGKLTLSYIAWIAREPWKAWGYCMFLVLCSFIPLVGGIMLIPALYGFAVLSLINLVMAIIHLARRNFSGSLRSLAAFALSAAMLVIPLWLFSFVFSGTKTRRDIDGCRLNLTNIAAAVSLYRHDNGNMAPSSLKCLTPSYMATIPICPAASRDTYSSSYQSSAITGEFTVFCKGSCHRGSVSSPDYPCYSSHRGLIIDPSDL